MSDRGIYVVAYGENARACAGVLIASAKRYMPEVPICLVSDAPVGDEDIFIQKEEVDEGARTYKLKVWEYAPQEWRYVLYLDADTEMVAPVPQIFEWLADGWDMVWTPDYAHEVRDHARWYADGEFGAMADYGDRLQLNGGVFAFRRNEQVKALLRAWWKEWLRWRGRDQMALTRAMEQAPVKIMQAGHLWNTFVHRIDPARTAGILHYPLAARRSLNLKHGAVRAWQAKHHAGNGHRTSTGRAIQRQPAVRVKSQSLAFFTVADEKYAEMLVYAWEEIRRYYPGVPYMVYDIGLSERTRGRLDDAVIIPFCDELHKRGLMPGEPAKIMVDERYYVRNEARGLHKPYVVRDALERLEADIIIHLDADAMPARRFAVPAGFDVGVTLRPMKKMKQLMGKIQPYYGLLNSGVLVFRRNEHSRGFVDSWIAAQEADDDPAQVDQKSLNAAVEQCRGLRWWKAHDGTYRHEASGAMVRVMRTETWNCSPGEGDLSRANIVHFKGGEVGMREFEKYRRTAMS
jgi:hypothetical protein